MSTEEKIVERIDPLEKSSKSTEYGIDGTEGITRMAPDKEKFDSLLKPPNPEKAIVIDKVPLDQARGSLFDEVRLFGNKVGSLGKVSRKDLVAQAEGVVRQIEEIKQKLATPNLEISKSSQTLLQSKLSHIDENLRVALSKAGLEYDSYVENTDKKLSPIERFLGFLTHGQAQLASLSDEVNRMDLNSKELSPVNMLRVQMKVGYITQEVEFFTSVLNKSLESTKTIMNVQV
jgi:hypothetical protein